MLSDGRTLTRHLSSIQWIYDHYQSNTILFPLHRGTEKWSCSIDLESVSVSISSIKRSNDFLFFLLVIQSKESLDVHSVCLLLDQDVQLDQIVSKILFVYPTSVVLSLTFHPYARQFICHYCWSNVDTWSNDNSCRLLRLSTRRTSSKVGHSIANLYSLIFQVIHEGFGYARKASPHIDWKAVDE